MWYVDWKTECGSRRLIYTLQASCDSLVLGRHDALWLLPAPCGEPGICRPLPSATPHAAASQSHQAMLAGRWLWAASRARQTPSPRQRPAPESDPTCVSAPTARRHAPAGWPLLGDSGRHGSYDFVQAVSNRQHGGIAELVSDGAQDSAAGGEVDVGRSFVVTATRALREMALSRAASGSAWLSGGWGRMRLLTCTAR